MVHRGAAMSKQKAIALMVLIYAILIIGLTTALVRIDELQERVNIIEISNLSSVNKNALETILERIEKDRETVQLLRKDFDNWSLMWDELFEGRK